MASLDGYVGLIMWLVKERLGFYPSRPGLSSAPARYYPRSTNAANSVILDKHKKDWGSASHRLLITMGVEIFHNASYEICMRTHNV